MIAKLSRVLAGLFLGCMALPADAQAQSFIPSQLTSISYCPGTTGRHIPHLTITKDSTGQSFTSAVAIENTYTYANNYTICAFTTDGVFVGGSSFNIPPNGRFYAVSPAAAGTLNLSDFLLPVKNPITTGPGSGAGGGGLPTTKDIHLYTSASSATPVSAGFVGNGGQLLSFYSVPVMDWSTAFYPHVGNVGGFETVFYVANPYTSTINVTFQSLDDQGNVKATSPRMAIAGLTRLTITASQLGFSGMGQVAVWDLNNNRINTLAVIVYPTSATGGAAISVQTPSFR